MTKYWGPEEIIKKKKEYIIPCLYHFYQEPAQIVRGEGQYLYDSTGKKYLDFFAGVSVINAGHCHPEITERICQQVKTLQHVCNIYLTQPMLELAEKLAEITPGRLKKSFFCNSGTEANEGAVLLAKIATGRSELLALEDGLHGRTYLTMSLTGMRFWRTDPTPAGGISFAPNAYCYRCPLNLTYPACDLACAEQLRRVIETSTSGEVAALIAEPIQGNAGIVTPPPEYFSRLKEILQEYGVLLIIDEVQTGFGRTGKWFAIENWGVEPDIMTMAKALGNGVPIGVFTSRPEIADKYTRPGASTLGGNPVSMTAGLATLEVIEKEGLIQNAAKLGTYLKEKLLELQDKHPLIGDVRGIGLMQGAELVKEGKEPAAEEVDRILEIMKNKGIIIGKNGRSRNVLAFQPPLVINKDNVDEMITALDDAFTQVEK
ncbi:MAG: aspartate aminotransferase family protein [Thermacetogeniaceae bacterium]|jgi:4-aminobutyrate aminotransferase/4-aminobutyrate aminotransferase/(S)-3-amino-2-methylpropionate transaminase|nr:aspartate aminotransferase family protein [Thermoanaerobacterales bacterium]NLN20797.1 aspartate aminotransferase family protein [Syntrophomonadaceae bacterium]HAF17167.1 aspartate aminotransferase family protein [Peptococcaceae bacterium]